MNKLILAVAIVAIILVAAFFMLKYKPATGPGVTGTSAAEQAAQDAVQNELNNALANSSSSIEGMLTTSK